MAAAKIRSRRRPAAEVFALWREVEAYLDAERERVAAEIRHYPTPIPRCDAQFNFLIERRERLGRDFERLRRADRTRADSLDAFLAQSEALEGSDRRALKERLSAALRPAASQLRRQ